MFKKSLASIVSAAVLVAGPGNLTLTAAAQTMGRIGVTGVSVTPTIGTGLHSPILSAPSFNTTALMSGGLIAPALSAAPSLVPAPVAAVAATAKPVALAATPVMPAAAKAMPATAKGSPLSVITSQDAKIGTVEKGAALNALFENSMMSGREAIEVLGQSAAASESGLSRSVVSAKSPEAIASASLAKGAAAGEAGVVSLIKRFWNAVLGILGIGVKKMETPAVMAQRIIDQLNAAKPVYNRKVQEASTLVEGLKLQVEGEITKVAELEQGITALLSDSDPTNDIMASGMINQQKTINASIATNKEQIVLAEKTLEGIKEERARFFSEREETMAKIQAGLTKAAAADIQKQIAELKGGFQIGDLKDNMDKFEDAVNGRIADARGTVDSVESNPDQILKKAKDSLKNSEVNDEIVKRKAAIEAARKAKGSAGGDASQSKALGLFAKAVGIGFALISPWLSSAVFALLGLFAIAMAPAQGRWLGRQLAVIGLGTLAIGAAASFAVAKLGLTMGAFGVGISFVVPALLALSVGVIATLRARGKDAATVASVSSTPAGSSVMTPVTAPTAAPAAPSAKFSLKPLLNLIARAWNALLGILGIGVKKMETPEILAQRLIDQLNDAKPVYNNKVREASTLVESLRLQIQAEQDKIADFDRTITALLSDSDPKNDIQAAGLLNSQKTLEASVAASKEQLAASEKALENIKEERARFFSEREETLAKIQAGLTKAKAADIQKQIAELKGGFQIGDLKDNLDRFDGAVNDKIADAKGTTDAVDSNPDQILKKAKDSLRTQEIADELAKRKAAIDQAKKDKGAAGGKLGFAGETVLMVALSAAMFYCAGPILALATAAGYSGGQLLLMAMGLGIAPLLTAAIISETIAYLSPGDDKGQTGGKLNTSWMTNGTPFGSYKIYHPHGQTVHVYGWSLSTRTFFQSLVLGAVAGPIMWAVFGGSLLWSIAGMALAPIVVDLLKPTWIYQNSAKNDKGQTGGLLLEVGIGAAVIAAVALASKPFRNLLARAWNVFLGLFGMGVKKLETPEVMAQRIVDQLNAAKPVYNRKVQEASTLVESLRLQIEKQAASSADLDRSVTAILSDSNPLNDVMAESLLNQKKTVDSSMAINKEQVLIAEKTLVSIKEERASFFAEREEMLAKVQAGLTKAKSADIQKQIAELKGGFQIGDLKDNMDKFEDAVNGKIADARGTVDSVESNPDQILKKAKDSLKHSEVNDEIVKRKAAIEAAKKAKQ